MFVSPKTEQTSALDNMCHQAEDEGSSSAFFGFTNEKGATSMEEIIQTEQTVTQEMETAVEQIPEKKRRKYIWLICLCVVIAAAAVFLCTGKLRKYDQAETLFAQKDYDAAAQIFEELANYRDSALRTKEVRHAPHEVRRYPF